MSILITLAKLFTRMEVMINMLRRALTQMESEIQILRCLGSHAMASDIEPIGIQAFSQFTVF